MPTPRRSGKTDRLSGEARELPDAGPGGTGEAVALSDYVRQNGQRFGMHAAALALLAGLLYLIRSKVRMLSQTDGNLRRTGKIFEMPIVSALLLSLLFTAWFYPRAPRMFWIAGGVFSAIPSAVSRRVIERHLYPVLYAVIGFYVVDKLRGILTPMPVIWRWALLAETVMFWPRWR